MRIATAMHVLTEIELTFQLLEVLIDRTDIDPLDKQIALREIIRDDIIKIRDAIQRWNPNPHEVYQKVVQEQKVRTEQKDTGEDDKETKARNQMV